MPNQTTVGLDAPQALALLVPVEEAARLLGLSRTKVFSLISSGELESVKIGRLRRVPRAALDAYVAGLRHAGTSL